jgi:uroporphyrinogen-III synthase
MRLLVTRPEPDAMKLAGRLQDIGLEATVEPLLRVSYEDGDAVELDGVAALIATSRHGLRALMGNPVLAAARHIPVFTVGRATAREARRMGFERVLVGPGTAAELVPAIAATLDSSEGLLMHLAGEALAVDLKGDLEQLGFRVLQPAVYRMEAAQALSASTIDQLNDGDIEGVILMSPRTARVYAGLIQRHRLTLASQRLVHFCLSRAVANGLAPLGDVPVAIPDWPTLQALLAEIELTAARRHE